MENKFDPIASDLRRVCACLPPRASRPRQRRENDFINEPRRRRRRRRRGVKRKRKKDDIKKKDEAWP